MHRVFSHARVGEAVPAGAGVRGHDAGRPAVLQVALHEGQEQQRRQHLLVDGRGPGDPASAAGPGVGEPAVGLAEDGAQAAARLQREAHLADPPLHGPHRGGLLPQQPGACPEEHRPLGHGQAPPMPVGMHHHALDLLVQPVHHALLVVL
eukprot:6081263-Lingulodinium_polyedra.AAC.1